MQWSLISQVTTILFLEGGNSKGKRWRRQKKKKMEETEWYYQYKYYRVGGFRQSFNPGGQRVNLGGQSRDQQSYSSR